MFAGIMRCITLVVVLAMAACGGKTSTPPAPPAGGSDQPAAGACLKTGCSGIICSDQDVMSTCEYKPEYACYKNATCERQPTGSCGWTESAELKACLASPPPM